MLLSLPAMQLVLFALAVGVPFVLCVGYLGAEDMEYAVGYGIFLSVIGGFGFGMGWKAGHEAGWDEYFDSTHSSPPLKLYKGKYSNAGIRLDDPADRPMLMTKEERLELEKTKERLSSHRDTDQRPLLGSASFHNTPSDNVPSACFRAGGQSNDI